MEARVGRKQEGGGRANGCALSMVAPSLLHTGGLSVEFRALLNPQGNSVDQRIGYATVDPGATKRHSREA